jgi:hypothetical protein
MKISVIVPVWCRIYWASRFNLSIMALDVDLYYEVRRAGVAWRRFLGKK